MAHRLLKADSTTLAESKYAIGMALAALVFFVSFTFYAFCFLQRPFLLRVEHCGCVFGVSIGVVIASLTSVAFVSQYVRKSRQGKRQKQRRKTYSPEGL
jgi:hypothetical protein